MTGVTGITGNKQRGRPLTIYVLIDFTIIIFVISF